MKKRMIVLFISLLLGLAASYSAYIYIQKLENTYNSSDNFVEVAIAKEKISARQVISKEMIYFKKIPANYTGSGIISKTENILGKITKSEIFPGEQILESNLFQKTGTDKGLSVLIDEGYRAMTISVDEISGLFGMIRPGDYIDILATIQVEKSDITSTLVQNIKVLAVNSSLDAQKNTPANETSSKAITVLLDPSQAQHVALASQKGKIQLILRGPSDNRKLALPSTNGSHLIR
ncbi:MAG: Flp pilus assembly protein CpaB [Peptococcaceae bacterium]|nr:Flp pilus assembly protein CpaB [Peptococcaceae bacterium]